MACMNRDGMHVLAYYWKATLTGSGKGDQTTIPRKKSCCNSRDANGDGAIVTAATEDASPPMSAPGMEEALSPLSVVEEVPAHDLVDHRAWGFTSEEVVKQRKDEIVVYMLMTP
jgi:hypothetical protein